MKLAFYFALGVVTLGLAYSMGPDLARYLKIRAM